jgi:hypothetical protein
MKMKIVAIGLIGSMLIALTPGCKKDKEGCTDPNADNYDSRADKNTECRYRFASNIDISDVPSAKPDGSGWDDGDGPDLKLNYGKSSSVGYSYTTNTAENAGSSATLMPSGSVQFTNEEWKFELVDVDLLGNETITTGTFNPLKGGLLNNEFSLETSNGTKFTFKYTIR